MGFFRSLVWLAWLALPAVATAASNATDLEARADAHARRGEYAAVEELLSAAPLADLSAGERARILARLAGVRVELGRYSEALETTDRARDAAAAAGDHRTLTQLEITRGSVARFRGRALDAISHYDSALEMAERLKAPDLVATVLSSLASVHQTLGNWSRVLDLNERSFAANPNPSDVQRFNYRIQRGIGLFEFGDGERARRSFETALAIAERRGDLRGQSLATGELGLVAWEFEHDAEAAVAAYDRAIELSRRSGVPALEASWQINSGALLRDVGDAEGATDRLRAGLTLAERVGLERHRTFLRKNLGQVLAARGEVEEAEPLLLSALTDADRLHIPKLQWQARMELAELFRDRDPARARQLFAESLAQLEATQAGVLLEQLQVDLMGRALEQYDPYERTIDFLMSRGEIAEAFLVAERGRARVFLNSLARMRSALAPEVPAEYLSSERAILEKISAEQSALRAPGLAAAERRAHLETIEHSEGELTVLRARLERENPALAHSRFPRLLRPEELGREVLGGDEVLVVYFLGRQRSWAWIVSGPSLTAAELPARDAIAKLVGALRAALERPGEGGARGSSEALYQALVAPVSGALDSGAHLVIVPHAALHFLPFEAITLPDGRYLVEEYSVSYAPSAASLAFLRRRAPVEVELDRALAMGNPLTVLEVAASEREAPLRLVGHLKPLPHSGEELRRVARALGGAVEVLEGSAATEAALAADDLVEVELLHFATHALVDEERPERSGLALTAEPPIDGLLQVREIYGLRLGAALVTLSACETALGREVAGEGLIGLTRAFFHAGASAVAATLWSVDDAAASELVARFYRQVRRGEPFDQALAEAKRSFLRDGGRLAHPYYWAPYILVGRADTRLRAAGSGAWTAAALAVLVALAAVAALMARARRRRNGATASS